MELCDSSISVNMIDKAPTVVVQIADQKAKKLGQSEALLDTGEVITIEDQRLTRSIGTKRKNLE